MAQLGQRQQAAAQDAVAARRQLQQEAGKGPVLSSEVRHSTNGYMHILKRYNSVQRYIIPGD